MLPSLPALTLDIPPALAHRQCLLAYSGGVDSSVLLHLLAAQLGQRLRAVHVHHGLQRAADDWEQHCRQECARLGIPFESRRIVIPPDDRGPEASARDARYDALRGAMRPDEVLVTAHHREDQAETVLIRLLRGSGPSGLSGIRGLSAFAPGLLWRPLLESSRDQIVALARARELRWIEDPHNQDSRYARSFLRGEILPRLRQHWPAADRAIVRSAALVAEADELLRSLAVEDLNALHQERRGSAREALPLTELRALSPARRRNLIRHWVEELGLSRPYLDSLRRLDAELLSADEDMNPVVAWPGAELRRYRDRLWAMPTLEPAPTAFDQAWDGCSILALPAGCGRLVAASESPGQPKGELRVRMPIGVARFRPARGGHIRSLKNLFQERGIPPWVRLRTPALLREGRICWIAGLGWADGAEPFDLEWRDPPPGANPV